MIERKMIQVVNKLSGMDKMGKRKRKPNKKQEKKLSNKRKLMRDYGNGEEQKNGRTEEWKNGSL